MKITGKSMNAAEANQKYGPCRRATAKVRNLHAARESVTMAEARINERLRRDPKRSDFAKNAISENLKKKVEVLKRGLVKLNAETLDALALLLDSLN